MFKRMEPEGWFVYCVAAAMLLAAALARVDRVSAAELLPGSLPTATPVPAPSPTATAAADVAAAATEPTVHVVTRTNVRSGPGTNYRVLAVAQPGASFAVTGKNAAGTWWQIDYNGGAAWIFADLVEAEAVEEAVVVAAPAADASSTGNRGASAAPAAPA